MEKENKKYKKLWLNHRIADIHFVWNKEKKVYFVFRYGMFIGCRNTNKLSDNEISDIYNTVLV